MKFNVSGAVDPSAANGEYVYFKNITTELLDVNISQPVYKHISQNYFLVPYLDDPDLQGCRQFYSIADNWDWDNLTGYFFKEDANPDPTGKYYNADEGIGNPIVSYSNSGTIGTAILKTDYIDKAYMGADGVAVDVS